ncbi:MAG TPA: 4Fe-4S dicluster domain-containing protein [bacterium]|nr:4Fe-4S dicluster domain-containing protein [bacterium]
MPMEFNRMKKWQDKLHVCIRCGYCFEFCHIFKVTGWESDTPRGKLIMLHGMMNGYLNPSEETAEKIFECYMCKRCDAACSAKVKVTELFTDAKADFVDAGFKALGTVSRTDPDKCSRCRICILACKHEARVYDAEKDEIVVDRVKCQSCGTCVAACPSGAAYSREGYGLSQKELRESVKQFLEGVSS